MARRSRVSILKRQRELKKAEKAARKRARRHGVPLAPELEPRATVQLGQPDESAPDAEDQADEGAEDSARTAESAGSPD